MTENEQKPISENNAAAVSDSPARADSRAHLIFWPLAVGGLALDLWTKTAVFAYLMEQPHYEKQIIEGFLTLVLAENEGAAFGIATGKQPLLVGVSVLALIAIIAFFLLGSAKQRLVQVAMGLFTAGVCGNLWDRIFNDGAVRDFILVYYRDWSWPAFNVADSLLCIAVGLLVISALFSPDRPDRKRDRQQK